MQICDLLRSIFSFDKYFFSYLERIHMTMKIQYMYGTKSWCISPTARDGFFTPQSIEYSLHVYARHVGRSNNNTRNLRIKT